MKIIFQIIIIVFFGAIFGLVFGWSFGQNRQAESNSEEYVTEQNRLSCYQ